jgi:hypothetical protein
MILLYICDGIKRHDHIIYSRKKKKKKSFYLIKPSSVPNNLADTESLRPCFLESDSNSRLKPKNHIWGLQVQTPNGIPWA